MDGSFKYVVNIGFRIIIFNENYGHFQLGDSENTIYGGFLELKDGEVVSISEKGSESLNKKSITNAREKDVEHFKNKVKQGDFRAIYKFK